MTATQGTERSFIGGPWDGRTVAIADCVRRLKVPGKTKKSIAEMMREPILLRIKNGIPQLSGPEYEVHTYELQENGEMHHKGEE